MNDTIPLSNSVRALSKELPQTLSISYQKIVPAQLILEDCFYTPHPSEAASELDLVNPIVVNPNPEGTFSVIDGYKRFKALTNNETILCKIVTPLLSAETQCILRILFNKNRNHTIREKYLYWHYITNNFKKETRGTLLHMLSISKKQVQSFTTLAKAQKETIEAFLSEVLDISLVENFATFTTEDQKAYLQEFKSLPLSLQNQREFTEWLVEIAYIQQKTIAHILSQPKIQEPLHSDVLNGPQKINKIRSYLYLHKFPRLSEAKSKWKKWAHTLNPDPAHITFEAHPTFEKNRLTVTVATTEAKKTKKLFEQLAALSNEDWTKLIYPK